MVNFETYIYYNVCGSLWNYETLLDSKKLEWWGYLAKKKSDDIQGPLGGCFEC